MYDKKLPTCGHNYQQKNKTKRKHINAVEDLIIEINIKYILSIYIVQYSIYIFIDSIHVC